MLDLLRQLVTHGTCFRFKTLPIRKCNILELLFFNVLEKGKDGADKFICRLQPKEPFFAVRTNKQKKQWIVSIFNLPRAWDYKDIIPCPTGDKPNLPRAASRPMPPRNNGNSLHNWKQPIQKSLTRTNYFFLLRKKNNEIIKANAFISNSMPINGYGRLSYRVSWLVTQSSIVRFGKDVAWPSKRTSAVPTSI